MNKIFVKKSGKLLLSAFISLLTILIFSFTSESYAQDNQESEKNSHRVHGSDIKRGERLFYGLVYEGGTVCADCHNTVEIEEFSWYPSALEIATKFRNKDISAFKKAVLKPSTPTMKRVHASAHFNDADIAMVKAYLDNVSVKGLTPKKPVIIKALLFVLFTLIIIAAIIDLFFTWKIKSKLIHLAVILLSVAGQIWLVSEASIALGRSENYAPDQPIKFSHKVHSGQNQIDCFYCHSTAEYSKMASVPPVQVCINCHILVAEGSNSGRYEIDKLKKAYAEKVPIEWIRVHNLPDHVYFNHAQHVAAGKLDCTECHGAVIEMDVLKQVEDLSMGWCIDCHRTREVDFDNNYYGDYKKLHDDLRSGEIDIVTVEQIGGTDCMKCHY